MSSDPVMQSVLRVFAKEADQLARTVERELSFLQGAEVEEQALAAHLGKLARALHTLKGSAGTVGLDRLSLLARRLEEQLAPLKRAPAPVPRPLAERINRGMGVFMQALAAHLGGGQDQREARAVEAISAELAAATLDAKVSAAPPPAREFIPPPDASTEVGDERVQAFFAELGRLRELRARLEDRRGELTRVLGELPLAHDARAWLLRVEGALRLDAEDAGQLVDAMDQMMRAMFTFPLTSLTPALRAAVDAACASAGKRARLAVLGAEVRVDRRVLEAMKEVLVELLRNAVEHGLEVPEVRGRAGKHEQGLLAVRIEQHGNMLFVEVGDDGAGVDLERARAHVSARGLFSGEQLAAMETPLLMRALLQDVRRALHALGGDLELLSTRGQGSRVFLNVPLGLGELPTLRVRAGEEEFYVPMIALERVVPAWAGDSLELEGERIPCIALAEALDLAEELPRGDGAATLIVRARGARAAVTVSELRGQVDVALKPLPRALRGDEPYQGAGPAEGGRVRLVLRPEWLVARAHAPPKAGRRLALAVDDSPLRHLSHRRALEREGFTVHAVTSPTRAIRLVHSTRYEELCIGQTGDATAELLAELARLPEPHRPRVRVRP